MFQSCKALFQQSNAKINCTRDPDWFALIFPHPFTYNFSILVTDLESYIQICLYTHTYVYLHVYAYINAFRDIAVWQEILTYHPGKPLNSKVYCEWRWLVQHRARRKTKALNPTALLKIAAQALGQLTLKRRR